MIDFELDKETNDLVFIRNDFSLVEATNQIMQHLAIRLRFFLGEWYLDTNLGVPFYQLIFVKSANQIQIESVLKQEIVQTFGVERLVSFESAYDESNRKYSVRFSAISLSGDELYKEMELRV